MRLTAHITSSSERMGQLEHRLGQVGSVLMGMIDTCRQLVGIVGTGLYHSMADVQSVVGRTVDPL